MSRPVKVKATRVPLRKSALPGGAAARRAFPAWIDATDSAGGGLPAAVTKRVRDSLVLRTVAKPKSTGKGATDDSGAR